ncbi:uncharacterized protein BDZ99DRAFT_411514 [Mytilinidion resinicola]|uniref:Ribosomal RNA-processing protein 7 n=1 Tax=Mytilinidion resinicola TaxID=574789 RepID=A0A6A6YVU4_9PEZI|nr:uncharacterized protein BDZ99DRAFT_411514 [Mytilinidion resinicola]KAF2813076.1 hypothetical protein BDZ99DRAFT_411514 [Mytilinidion resinicola]
MPSAKPSPKSRTSRALTSVSSFTILPLTLPALPALKSQPPAPHYLYIQPHAPKLPEPDTERSLFLANIPIDATDGAIRALFADQLGGGRVERVVFEATVPSYAALNTKSQGDSGGARRGKKRKRGVVNEDKVGVVEDAETALPRVWERGLCVSGSSAVVVFVDRASAKGAWVAVKGAVKGGEEVVWRGEGGLGEKRYRDHHSLTFPPRATLQKSINAYLTAFTEAETTRDRLRAKQRAVPDEDGFVTVVRGGRIGPARLEEAQAAKEKADEKDKKRIAKDDFYRFQTREKKKEREMDLRRKFEEDRKKVQEMRERRGKVVPMS